MSRVAAWPSRRPSSQPPFVESYTRRLVSEKTYPQGSYRLLGSTGYYYYSRDESGSWYIAHRIDHRRIRSKACIRY